MPLYLITLREKQLNALVVKADTLGLDVDDARAWVEKHWSRINKHFTGIDCLGTAVVNALADNDLMNDVHVWWENGKFPTRKRAQSWTTSPKIIVEYPVHLDKLLKSRARKQKVPLVEVMEGYFDWVVEEVLVRDIKVQQEFLDLKEIEAAAAQIVKVANRHPEEWNLVKLLRPVSMILDLDRVAPTGTTVGEHMIAVRVINAICRHPEAPWIREQVIRGLLISSDTPGSA